MTQNNKQVSLQEYNQEIQPLLRTLFKKQDIIKEWAKEDTQVAEFKEQIKEINDKLKAYIEETESQLTREISDLKLDIKLAVKGAAKASGYKAAELNAYFNARAKEKVDDAITKAELFTELNSALG